jgi:hypothetical protein
MVSIHQLARKDSFNRLEYSKYNKKAAITSSIQKPGRVVSKKMEITEIASTLQANTMAPILAQDLRTSNPIPNKKPKKGAILMFPVGSTNQVLKYIGKNIVIPNKSKVQSTSSVWALAIVRDIANQWMDLSLQK